MQIQLQLSVQLQRSQVGPSSGIQAEMFGIFSGSTWGNQSDVWILDSGLGIYWPAEEHTPLYICLFSYCEKLQSIPTCRMWTEHGPSLYLNRTTGEEEDHLTESLTVSLTESHWLSLTDWVSLTQSHWLSLTDSVSLTRLQLENLKIWLQVLFVLFG